jgi:hypothetical protein
MEVLLKKSKITSSVLAQTLIASISDLKSSKVLGWCVYKKHKYIVLYNSQTNELRKYFLFKEVKSQIEHINKPFSVWVDFGIGLNSLTYTTIDQNESQELLELLEKVKQQAIMIGQFFL